MFQSIALAIFASLLNPAAALDAGVAIEMEQEAMPEIVSLTLAGEVANRNPVAPSTEFIADGRRVYAHIAVDCPVPEAQLSMVWRRGGKIVQSLPVTVKKSPRWRTWSYKTLRAYDVGEWTVEVLDAEGTTIAHTAFVVQPPPAPIAQGC